MASLLVKGLIAIDDMNLGTSTFLRQTSTGGTATLTQVDFVRQTTTGTQTLAGSLVVSTLTASGIVSRAANPAQSGTIRLGNTDSIAFRNLTNAADIVITSLGASSGNRPADVIRFFNAGGIAAPPGGGFSSESAQTSVTGLYKLANAEVISWRNNANGADVALAKDTSDRLTFNSQIVSDGAHANGLVIASGTATLTSNATLGATTAQAAVTVGATGAATTDAIEWAYATAPSSDESLCIISAYVTSGNVNFVRANPTAGNRNVTAIVINWRVIR